MRRHISFAALAIAGLLATGFGPAVAPATAPAVTTDAWLTQQLATASPDAEIGVIVYGQSLAATHAALVDAGMAASFDLTTIDATVATGTAAQIESLTSARGITQLEGDRPLEYTLDTAHRATRADLPADFVAPDGLAIDGSGVSIAIVDSGIDGTHPMFQREDGTSKVARNFKTVCEPVPVVAVPSASDCLVNDPTNDTDTTAVGGHGTHVASIAAGLEVTTTDGRTLRGAAPGATLIGFSTGATALVKTSWTYGAFEWILLNHEDPCGDGSCPPIRVVNNSYGGDTTSYSATSGHARLGAQLVGAGVVVAWAAGNDGGDGTASATNGPGSSPVPGILMVANYNDAGIGAEDGSLDSSSSRGQRGAPATYPDISAPGTDITAACRPWLAICSTGADGGDPDYDTISGTSMATPYIVGVVARLFQANPALTPGDVEEILTSTALKFGDAASYEPDTRSGSGLTSFDKGHGLVDVTAAVAAALGREHNQPAPGCVPGYPVIYDAAGDALGLDPFSGEANETNIDIVGGSFTTDPVTGAVTVELQFTDIDLPSFTTAGNWVQLHFAHAGIAYIVDWNYLAAGAASLPVNLSGADGTDVDLVGDIDPARDVIWATIPADAPATAALASGVRLSELEVVSYHNNVTGGYEPDTAGSNCAFVVGSDVERPNEAPVAAFTYAPSAPRGGEAVTFDASTTTDDAPFAQLSFAWDFDGDGAADATGPVVTRAFGVGDVEVALTVTDADGASDTATQTVTVAQNQEPTSIATASETKAEEGETLWFTGSASSDPDGDALTYAWDFADGTTAEGEVVTHAFGAPGRYVVTLTVTDGYGGVSVDDIVIRVSKY